MKREYILPAAFILTGAAAAAAGVCVMIFCDLFVAGAAVMTAGLALFIPACPVYQKLAGKVSVFADARTAAVFIFGAALLACAGAGIALALCPYECAESYRLGGALLAGFSAALLVVNAFIPDCFKRADS